MAYRLEILPHQRLALILYSGSITRDDFDVVWQKLSASKDFDWDFDEIAVFGPDADLAGLNFESVDEEARRFKSTHEAVPVKRTRRSAILVSNQVQVLGARMFLAFVASNPPPHVMFKLFNRMNTAITWIEEGRPQGDAASRIDKAEVERAMAAIDQARRGGSPSQRQAS